jgi:endonuclease YncB( thermonuclease family)
MRLQHLIRAAVLCLWALLAVASNAPTGKARAANHPAAHASPLLPGVVVGIVDGDTADVKLASGMIRIRLLGIDAPEMGQAFGGVAKARLSSLVYGQDVLLEPYEQDRYDRLVARLWLGDRDINAEMIRSGFAWVYRRYADDPAYCQHEKAARDQHRGLWQAAPRTTVAPWEWRKRKTLDGQYTDYSDESVAACVATLGK